MYVCEPFVFARVFTCAQGNSSSIKCFFIRFGNLCEDFAVRVNELYALAYCKATYISSFCRRILHITNVMHVNMHVY